jgi:uncharacterized membrane protein
MKTANLIATTGLIWMATAGSAFAAAAPTRVFNSGILVIGFLAICALVVVVQLIPAIMTLVGMLRGTANNSSAVEAEAKK